MVIFSLRESISIKKIAPEVGSGLDWPPNRQVGIDFCGIASQAHIQLMDRVIILAELTGLIAKKPLVLNSHIKLCQPLNSLIDEHGMASITSLAKNPLELLVVVYPTDYGSNCVHTFENVHVA